MFVCKSSRATNLLWHNTSPDGPGACNALLRRLCAIVSSTILCLSCNAPPPTIAATADAVVNFGSPQISSDGTKVLATSETGVSQIYMMAPDGSGLRVMTAATGLGAFSPAWSADQESFYFVQVERTPVARQFRTTFFRHNILTGLDTAIRIGINENYPRPTPDGQTVFFQGGTLPHVNVEALDLRTGTTRIISGMLDRAYDPAISPNGKKVAYVCKRDTEPDNRICTMSLDGSNNVELSRLPGTAERPAWSSDSARIAYQLSVGRGVGADANIIVINANGSDEHAVTLRHVSPELDETPAWFPDGQRMLIQTSKGGGVRIAVLSLDGTASELTIHSDGSNP